MIASSFSLLFLLFVNGESRKLVDLSYGYDKSTLMWPGGEKFHYYNQHTGPGEGSDVWYSANDFATAEHSGTHIDAPYHFNRHGKTVDQIPLERFFVKGVLVNVSTEYEVDDKFLLTSQAFKNWEKKHGPMPNNSVVLVDFGWGKRYPNKTLYLGPSDTDLRFPSLSAEAGQWLVNSKRVLGVGSDTASPDDPRDPAIPVHVLFSSNDMYILENINLTHPLPHLFDLVLLPMKLVKGTGGPVRIVAIL